MKYIPQFDTSDCGAACLAMIASSYGSRKSYVPIFPEADSIVMNLEKVFQNWSDYQNLILGGLETVSQWTWERSVNRHLEVFEQILQGEKALVEG